MNKEQQNLSSNKKKKISLIDKLDQNSKRYLLLNNFEKINRRRDSLTTRKINVIEEKIKYGLNTSRNKNYKSNDIKNHCLYGKECIYYKKYIKLKKEIDSILNINSKLNLFIKSLYVSFHQKTKDYQYLMKENTILKKELSKLNGLNQKEILKNKNEFRVTKLNISNNKNNNNINKDVKSFFSKKPKIINMDNIYKISNTPKNKISNFNRENKKQEISSLSSSDNSNSIMESTSFFKEVKKNKTYNQNQKIFKDINNKPNKNCNKLSSSNNPVDLKTQPSKDMNKRNSIIYKRKPSEILKFEDSPNKHYEAIKKFNYRRGRSSTIFTQKYSLLSLNIDLFSIMNNNIYLNKLQNLIISDEHFLSTIRNSTENQLLKYSDLISCLINDYKENIKLGMRMKDFMKSSLSLVDSIISNDSSKVFIDNTCQILKCDRASLFVLDQISDSLILYSGEGIKKAQIKVPKDKGIVGACFLEGKKIRIDDAYTDQRFNKEIDIRTNYKTNNILCYPLLDHDEKCFGVIEAINKYESPFNDDDEELLKLLSHQASTIFKNAFFNDNNKFYINKLFLLIKYCNKIFHIKNKKEFTEKTEDLLLNLYNCMKSALFFVENEKIVKYMKDSENKKEFENNIGIIGKVFKSKEVMAYENIKNSTEYNSIIDLESPSGLLAIPVLMKKTKNVGIIIEVPFSGDINNLGKPKENEMIMIKYLSKCIKNWLFEFEKENK